MATSEPLLTADETKTFLNLFERATGATLSVPEDWQLDRQSFWAQKVRQSIVEHLLPKKSA